MVLAVLGFGHIVLSSFDTLLLLLVAVRYVSVRPSAGSLRVLFPVLSRAVFKHAQRRKKSNERLAKEKTEPQPGDEEHKHNRFLFALNSLVVYLNPHRRRRDKNKFNL